LIETTIIPRMGATIERRPDVDETARDQVAKVRESATSSA
jgi:hypothetical protein